MIVGHSFILSGFHAPWFRPNGSPSFTMKENTCPSNKEHRQSLN